jgi:hypothetical protein
MKKSYKDISGNKYGNLLALSVSYKDNNSRYYWNGLCDYGNNIIIQGNRYE